MIYLHCCWSSGLVEPSHVVGTCWRVSGMCHLQNRTSGVAVPVQDFLSLYVTPLAQAYFLSPLKISRLAIGWSCLSVMVIIDVVEDFPYKTAVFDAVGHFCHKVQPPSDASLLAMSPVPYETNSLPTFSHITMLWASPTAAILSSRRCNSPSNYSLAALNDHKKLPTRVAIFFDLTNQFNSISRKDFFNVISTSFPELLPLTTLFMKMRVQSTINGMMAHGAHSP
jgi:hypothetical protein